MVAFTRSGQIYFLVHFPVYEYYHRLFSHFPYYHNSRYFAFLLSRFCFISEVCFLLKTPSPYTNMLTVLPIDRCQTKFLILMRPVFQMGHVSVAENSSLVLCTLEFGLVLEFGHNCNVFCVSSYLMSFHIRNSLLLIKSLCLCNNILSVK